MTYRLAWIASVVLIGCEGAVPEIGNADHRIPEFAPPMTVSVRQGVSNSDAESVAAASDSDEVEDPGSCLEWVTEVEDYDEETCTFEYLYTCAEGGDLASSHTVGGDDCLGNGSYTTTYVRRDGSEYIWEYEVETAADYSKRWYHGVSSEGETSEVEYTFGYGGETFTYEVWTYADGVYITDGRYETDGRFNGTYSFDDPSTAADPDWTIDQSQDVDGTLTQLVHSVAQDWMQDYTYVVHPDGSADYDYDYDQLSTAVDPDFSGTYFYGADGASEGGYTQLFDDGSVLMVEHVFNWNTPGYTESWTFDDAGTVQPIDQQGSMTYDDQGNGTGTITTFIAGGATETCDVTVSADGTTVVDNCQ